jgi:uroporphyrinogen-III synthase
VSPVAAPRPTVVVTRPAAQAEPWVAALHQAGWPVLPLPLIDTAPVADAATLRATIGPWHDWDAVMAVSPAAVEVLRAAGVPAPPAGVRCWASGEGTAQAWRAWGVDPARIDQPPHDAAQMDSEALWPVVRHQLGPGVRVLIVRGVSPDGRTGRDWLAQRCREAGARVEERVVYRRGPPAWDADRAAQARQAVGPSAVWLFSSSEAIANLAQLLPHAPWGHTRAIATHPRIADAARALGLGQVHTCRPALPDVLQALESLT